MENLWSAINGSNYCGQQIFFDQWAAENFFLDPEEKGVYFPLVVHSRWLLEMNPPTITENHGKSVSIEVTYGARKEKKITFLVISIQCYIDCIEILTSPRMQLSP